MQSCTGARNLVNSGRLVPLAAENFTGDWYRLFQLDVSSSRFLESERTNYSWHDEYFETTDVPTPIGLVDFDTYEYLWVSTLVTSAGVDYRDGSRIESVSGQSRVTGILRVKRNTTNVRIELERTTRESLNNGDPTMPGPELNFGSCSVTDVKFYPMGIASPWMPPEPSFTNPRNSYTITPWNSFANDES